MVLQYKFVFSSQFEFLILTEMSSYPKKRQHWFIMQVYNYVTRYLPCIKGLFRELRDKL